MSRSPADTPSTDSSTTPEPASVDSRWWYVVAATPVFAIVSGAFVLWFVVVALLGFGFGGRGAVGLVAVLAFLFVGFLGLVLSVAFPVAIYLDAEAVVAADVGWEPDSFLYALVAALSVFATAFALSLAVAAYYLYQRHKHVGVP